MQEMNPGGRQIPRLAILLLSRGFPRQTERIPASSDISGPQNNTTATVINKPARI